MTLFDGNPASKTSFSPLLKKRKPKMSNTPAEIYLDIAQRVNDEENYQIARALPDLHALLHATASLIRENASLKEENAQVHGLNETLTFQVFEKDVELFNAVNQLNNPEGGVLV